jgi:hypothetical protein
MTQTPPSIVAKTLMDRQGKSFAKIPPLPLHIALYYKAGFMLIAESHFFLRKNPTGFQSIKIFVWPTSVKIFIAITKSCFLLHGSVPFHVLCDFNISFVVINPSGKHIWEKVLRLTLLPIITYIFVVISIKSLIIKCNIPQHFKRVVAC